MTAYVHAVNIFFAGAAALAAFGSLNKMNGTTSFVMKATFATLCAAMVGQVFMLAMPERWHIVINTLAYGGIASLLIGSRRASILLSEKAAQRLALAALAVTWIVFFSGA